MDEKGKWLGERKKKKEKKKMKKGEEKGERAMEEIRKIMAELGYGDGEVWRPVLHLLEEEPDEFEDLDDFDEFDEDGLDETDDMEDNEGSGNRDNDFTINWDRMPYGRKLIDGFYFGAHV